MKKNITALAIMINQIYAILTDKQRKRTLFVFAWILFGSIWELMGISFLVPYMQAIVSPEALKEQTYIKICMDIFKIKSNTTLILFLGIGLAGIYIIKNICLLISYYIQYNYSAKVQKELSTKMLKTYMDKPYRYFLDINSAEVIRGTIDDITTVYNIIANFFTIFTEILTISLIAVYILMSDIVTAGFVLGLSFFALIVIVLGYKPIVKIMGERRREAHAECVKYVTQPVRGIKEITVLQRKEEFIKTFERAADKNRVSQCIYDFALSSPERIIEAICVSGIIIVISVRVAIGVDMSEFIPKMAAFAMAAFKILPSVGKISGRISALVFQRPALEGVYDILCSDKNVEKVEQKLNEREIVLDEQSKLNVENVSWKYYDEQKDVLKNVSFSVSMGEAIAIIGPSGGGKTTLIDIILGLLVPEKGMITINGIDIRKIPFEWAKIIGYVPQSSFILDDTIRRNVALGISDDKIDDALVWEALEKAQLSKFVKDLPEQLDTVVGESGVRFSGGQRQRITIARALYDDPTILILDEATASLDNKTETSLMEAIELLHGKKTLIIVAHRLSTIKKCDKIYEINNGVLRSVSREKVLKNE